MFVARCKDLLFGDFEYEACDVAGDDFGDIGSVRLEVDVGGSIVRIDNEVRTHYMTVAGAKFLMYKPTLILTYQNEFIMFEMEKCSCY